MTPRPIPPQPGEESVWDYPRPPRLEPTSRRLRVIVAGHVIAETTRGHRILETSHPPVYYFPIADVDPARLRVVGGTTGCEWKGTAMYFDIVVGTTVRPRAAWSYPRPTPGMEAIENAIAFYASLADECTVDGRVVTPQPGQFYGGWITPDIIGPFKGEPGTAGW